MQSGTKILQLVQPKVSTDAIEAAEKLLADVRAGVTVGFAVVAMHNVHSYTTDIAGECKRYQAATRGMVQALDDELAPALPSPA